MCVYTYVCVCVGVSVCIHSVYGFVGGDVCVYVSMCLCVSACLYTCVWGDVKLYVRQNYT